MGNLSLPKGSIIYQAETPLNHIACIIKGSICASAGRNEFTLRGGDVIGIIDVAKGIHSFTYEATEDCLIVSYPFKGVDVLEDLLNQNATLSKCALGSIIRQIGILLDSYLFKQYDSQNLYTFLKGSYEEYHEHCRQLLISPKAIPLSSDTDTSDDEIPVFNENQSLDPWLRRYYEDLAQLQEDHATDHFITQPGFLSGMIVKTSLDVAVLLGKINETFDYQAELSTLLLNENHLDFYDLFTSLTYHSLKIGSEDLSLTATVSTLENEIRSNPFLDKELAEKRLQTHRAKIAKILARTQSNSEAENSVSQYHKQLQNSMDVILKYSDCSPETALSFKELVLQYRATIDKNSTSDTTRKLRLDLTKLFYEIYLAAFKKSLDDPNIPLVVKMFFLFGYVDEKLAGEENAAYLCAVAEFYKGDPEKHIYTMYDWLTAIYRGIKEPRRNEYDVDYSGYVHEQMISQRISKQDEQDLLNNADEKLLFEFQNFFMLTNKRTYGRVSVFCPVFSEHNMLIDPEDALLTPDRLDDSLNNIRKIDYSVFYRDELLFDASSNLRETVQKEYMPDIILLPNAGTRGIMWQEIDGKRRNSSATYALPVFMLENADQALIKMTGEYRFEICRRTQGSRWNDVSDPSLTSEYCDYAQFYRKYNELSSDAKEKVRLALSKARGSYKNMFVQDYITWITAEGNGSPRLNKVARKILFMYCPFSKEIRSKLASNPLYHDAMQRWTHHLAQQRNRLENLIKKLENSGKAVPEELSAQRDYLNL
ncbi:MAG: Crp/Fnr family transcriptional regulator [Lachnospiraceae bacterium]|nr:Crp/Fnr family transcriptional regulator [Lachnospiraceae bacterium]